MPTPKIDALNEEFSKSSKRSQSDIEAWEAKYVALFESMQIGKDAFSIMDVPKPLQTNVVMEAAAKTSPLAALHQFTLMSRADTYYMLKLREALHLQGVLTEEMYWSMGENWLTYHGCQDKIAESVLSKLQALNSEHFAQLTNSNMAEFVAITLKGAETFSPEQAVSHLEQLATDPELCSLYVEEAYRQGGCAYKAMNMGGRIPGSMMGNHIKADLSSLPLPFITRFQKFLDGDWRAAIAAHKPPILEHLILSAGLHPASSRFAPLTYEQANKLIETFELGSIAKPFYAKQLIASCKDVGAVIDPAIEAATLYLSHCSSHHFFSSSIPVDSFGFLKKFMTTATEAQISHFTSIVVSGLTRINAEQPSNELNSLLAANIMDGAASKVVHGNGRQYYMKVNIDRTMNRPTAHQAFLKNTNANKSYQDPNHGTVPFSIDESNALITASQRILRRYIERCNQPKELALIGVRKLDQIEWFTKKVDLSKLASPVKRWLVRGAVAGMTF